MYNMSVYCITLNHEKMCDSALTNLINSIPPSSIVVFDEIDKQLVDKPKRVSIGGILSAIDGPSRLPTRCLVILTSNVREFLTAPNMEALVRPGRIDQAVECAEPFGR